MYCTFLSPYHFLLPGARDIEGDDLPGGLAVTDERR